MATGKRYYWIKLKESFMFSDAVDFLMSQPDGANYVVLYQMLCLKTINTDGKLERHIGEVLIPYDEAKIQRDCKWFSIDTVRVALNLYKALGLVYVDVDGTLRLTDHDNLVGSETDYAEKNRRMRANHQNSLPEGSSGTGHNVSETVSEDVSENVSTDIRDKSLEIREQSKEIDIRSNISDSNESDCRASAQRIIEAWNELPIESKVHRMSANSTRAKCLRARIREYGEDRVLFAVGMIRNSDFLLGKKTSFQITFDWFVKPDNFAKILSGNYNNRSTAGTGNAAADNLNNFYGMASDWATGGEE